MRVWWNDILFKKTYLGKKREIVFLITGSVWNTHVNEKEKKKDNIRKLWLRGYKISHFRLCNSAL